jgi:serine phosphatase RsbU (regulator of sigma subunit)
VADPTSGDPSARPANGRVEGLQDPSSTDAAAVADAETVADADQTLADSDQTLSDADQTSSDGDQTSADEDQLAADRDQAASDRDLASGVDPRAHELSHDLRERSTRQREESARGRNQIARLRLGAADRRDAIADSRDVSGRQRDEAAAARATAMAELDAAFEREDDARAHSGADAIVRAAGQRRRAAERRAQAATYRDLAAHDRRAAAFDREQAAQERLNALADREALAGELQREQERRDEALRHQRHAEKLARTLQRSLSPPRLPRIAGLDVCVHCEPFAPEAVGGDFYDLFPLVAGRAGFFLGDVCGKGPEAAAVTSLARYTMRTAAMLHESPAAILADLNSALLMDSPEPMGCTAVYGQIDMSSGPATIILAVGGHPAPLVVRADGSVEVTPAQGTMLGAVQEPAFRTCEVRLAVGDAIIVYSDGILDSEIDGARVDEQRVGALLSGPPAATAAELVGRLRRAVRGTEAPLRDDVAFLALRCAPGA